MNFEFCIWLIFPENSLKKKIGISFLNDPGLEKQGKYPT